MEPTLKVIGCSTDATQENACRLLPYRMLPIAYRHRISPIAYLMSPIAYRLCSSLMKKGACWPAS